MNLKRSIGESPSMSFRTIFQRKFLFYHLLVLPGVIYFVIFHYLPILGNFIAFTDYRGMGGVWGILRSPWVGFENFEFLFGSHYFWRLLRNTLLISFYRLVWAFPAPIILALVLNEIQYSGFKKVVQTITYLPHFVSWVIVAGLMSMLLSTTGPVNSLLAIFGTGPVTFLADSSYFRSMLVASSVWKEIGWGSIIYLAAISNVPNELYEVAFIEGANRFQRMIYVTLPSIAFIIVILLILRVGKIINENFEQIFNLYNPVVYEVADVFETYVYRRGIENADFSYATAVGLFKSVTSLILVAATNRVAKLLHQESLW